MVCHANREVEDTKTGSFRGWEHGESINPVATKVGAIRKRVDRTIMAIIVMGELLACQKHFMYRKIVS